MLPFPFEGEELHLLWWELHSLWSITFLSLKDMFFLLSDFCHLICQYTSNQMEILPLESIPFRYQCKSLTLFIKYIPWHQNIRIQQTMDIPNFDNSILIILSNVLILLYNIIIDEETISCSWFSAIKITNYLNSLLSCVLLSMPITIPITALITHNIKIPWMVHHIQTKRLTHLQQHKNPSPKHKKPKTFV
jgi:hypothetical protein